MHCTEHKAKKKQKEERRRRGFKVCSALPCIGFRGSRAPLPTKSGKYLKYPKCEIKESRKKCSPCQMSKSLKLSLSWLQALYCQTYPCLGLTSGCSWLPGFTSWLCFHGEILSSQAEKSAFGVSYALPTGEIFQDDIEGLIPGVCRNDLSCSLVSYNVGPITSR